MKKRKLNIINILIAILCLIVILMILFFILNKFKKDFKITLKDNTIEVGQEFKNEFKAVYKGIDVTSNVVSTNNIDINVAGTYEVNYIYRNYNVIKKVQVIDTTPPKISLKGGMDIIVMTNQKFDEPGFVALDNSDGDITENVTIEGNVDTSKEGEYIIKYNVSDKSGNKAEVTRKVTVTSSSPLNMDVKSFSLEGLFTSVTLKETEDAGDSYIDNIIFAGDSMALYYVINGQISGSHLWHQISITPETALTSPIYINHQDTNKTFVQNFKIHKPDTVIMTLGTNSAAYMSSEYFYEKYYELVTQIKEASPNTKLIIQSIPPVDKKFDEDNSGINNDKINKLNYYIGKMCEELDVKFLNSASALKDENGTCKQGYCLESDGIHTTKEGQKVLIDYARTHAFQNE